MAVKSPCKYCVNKGCGEYHSQCPDYIKYDETNKRNRESARNHMKITETLRDIKFNLPPKKHCGWKEHE